MSTTTQNISCSSSSDDDEHKELLLRALRTDDDEIMKLLHVHSLEPEKEGRNWTLLREAIIRNRKKVFDYLLSLDNYPADLNEIRENRRELLIAALLMNPIIHSGPADDHYAYELLQKDVEIQSPCTRDGSTFLHYAFKYSLFRVAKLLIEKNADISAQNDNLETPFHWCCMYCKDENLIQGVSLLMYYGADPSTTTKDGHTPFDIAVLKNKDYLPILEDLFHYSFDKDTHRDVDFGVLLKAMEKKWPLLDELLENTSTVYNYDRYLSNYGSPHLFAFDPKYVMVFMEKFDYVIERMVAKLFYYEDDMLEYSKLKNPHSLEILDLLVNSKYEPFVIDIICEVQSTGLLDGLIAYKMPQNTIACTICYLLSYGMTVTDDSLQMIYTNFQYNELFQILLYMDIEEDTYEAKNILPHLYYNVSFHIENYLKDPYNFRAESEVDLLPYCSRPELKELCCKLNRTDINEKVTKLPQVPPLIELARDTFRKYFIEKLEIKTSRRFYTMLKLLPIAESQKKIISLQTKLFLV